MPKKKLTAEARLMIARHPVAVVEAWNVLVERGADPVALFRVIKNMKKSRNGAPSKEEEISRLAWSVSEYQVHHPGVSDKHAIAAVVQQSESYRKLKPEEQEGVSLNKVEALYMALWRLKKRRADEIKKRELLNPD